jgi:hypothetical protein
VRPGKVTTGFIRGEEFIEDEERNVIRSSKMTVIPAASWAS